MLKLILKILIYQLYCWQLIIIFSCVNYLDMLDNLKVNIETCLNLLSHCTNVMA